MSSVAQVLPVSSIVTKETPLSRRRPYWSQAASDGAKKRKQKSTTRVLPRSRQASTSASNADSSRTKPVGLLGQTTQTTSAPVSAACRLHQSAIIPIADEEE